MPQIFNDSLIFFYADSIALILMPAVNSLELNAATLELIVNLF